MCRPWTVQPVTDRKLAYIYIYVCVCVCVCVINVRILNVSIIYDYGHLDSMLVRKGLNLFVGMLALLFHFHLYLHRNNCASQKGPQDHSHC